LDAEELYVTSPAATGPETTHDVYDVAIIGGGLAGLSLAIQLKNAGCSVILFEKESYPFHRVCGEYISMESWDFLNGLGLDLESLGVSRIRQLQLSSVGGRLVRHRLQLGGFGISRYLLDSTLCARARELGVTILENTRVNNIHFANDMHHVETSRGFVVSRVACGSFGKRSNMDVKWKRSFITRPKNKLNNFIGIKYHVKAELEPDTIALHLFPHGYCGIVKIEGGMYNLCYLTTAANLQRAGGNITNLEKDILSINPHLSRLFNECERIQVEPLTISQVSFDKKNQVQDHVLLAGDAAGMITPLCGNGMSMGLHASKLVSKEILSFLEERISRKDLELNYTVEWQRHFGKRLRAGRIIQSMFSHAWLTNFTLGATRVFPSIADRLIGLTHGRPF
jgi:flavin-dependent dehydrogenase